MNYKLLIADDLRQETSGKMTLVGLYPTDEILLIKDANTPPPEGLEAFINKLSILVVITEVGKPVDVKAQFIRPSGAPLTEIQDMGHQNTDGLAYMNLIMDLPFFPVPETGIYTLRVFIDEDQKDLEFTIKFKE